MKKLAGIDVNQIMQAAGMERAQRKFTPPQASADRNKEKRKRKEARKQRKKSKKRR